jgi:HPt (histidine-containing phosphotransfer) domain-containing protein
MSDSNLKYSLTGIEEIAGGDKDFVLTILRTFQTNTPKYLKKIEEGIEGGYFELVGHAAHQLKPSFDILAITEACAIVREIEAETKKSEIDSGKIKSNFDTLNQIVAAVMEDMVKLTN